MDVSFILGVLGMLMIVLILIANLSITLHRRLSQMNHKLDALLKHHHLELPPDQQWQTYARQGEKIQAIKFYREQTGLGLADSKEAVEQWMRENGA